jgi:hypothetical protein
MGSDAAIAISASPCTSSVHSEAMAPAIDIVLVYLLGLALMGSMGTGKPMIGGISCAA